MAQALYAIHVSNTTVISGGGIGWSVPLSYQPVHECMQELQVSPYEDYGDFSLIDVVSKYWHVPLALIIIILLTIAYSHKIVSVNRELESEISMRKQAEQALYCKQEQLLSICGKMEEAIYVADPETYELLYVNDVLKRIWGDGVGRKCYSVLQGQDTPCPFCTNDHIFGDNTGKSYVWEFQNKRDNNWYRCIDRAIEWPDGRMVRFEMGINIQDIKDTEAELEEYRDHLEELVEERTIKLAEANTKLQKSEHKYSSLIEHGNDGIIILQDGLLKFANMKMLEIANYRKDDVIGRPFMDFVSPKYKKLVMEYYKKRMAHDADIPEIYEISIISKDNRTIPVEMNPSFIEYEGKPADMAIVRDITERKKAEEALKKYAADLEHSNEMKDIFTDIMRHDLLNPANIINGFTSLLLGTETDESKRRQLEKIKNNNTRLIEMIRNASKFSKLDSTDSIQFERADIGSLMKKAVSSLEHESRDKQMNIELPAEGPYPAHVNPLIGDVFVNLLSNAIKYSPAGSRVKIDVIDAGDMWKVMVTDVGEGVSDENKSLVFKRHKRVSKKGVKGSGLGLAIVKRIIDLHGGNVGVEDNPQGQGSVFWVSMKKA